MRTEYKLETSSYVDKGSALNGWIKFINLSKVDPWYCFQEVKIRIKA